MWFVRLLGFDILVVIEAFIAFWIGRFFGSISGNPPVSGPFFMMLVVLVLLVWLTLEAFEFFDFVEVDFHHREETGRLSALGLVQVLVAGVVILPAGLLWLAAPFIGYATGLPGT